jgi:2-methylcitrate dehydratase
MPYTFHNAVQACQMARNGLTGPEHVFDGNSGFFEALSDGAVEFEALGGRDGAGYRIMETSFKAYACGYFTHPPITAVLDIVHEHDLGADDIESIDIRAFSQTVQVYASGPEKWDTDLTRETADHSLPYNVSVAVLFDEVKPEYYDEEYLRNENIHEMMQKISVEADESLDQYRRENPRHVPAVAELETVDGETYESRANYPLGHPERPMSEAEIESKAEDLVDPYLTDAQIEDMIDRCHSLADADAVDDLVSTLVI